MHDEVLIFVKIPKITISCQVPLLTFPLSCYSRERQVFRVFIVLPLLPGFEGDVAGSTGNSLRLITHWNYASICR